MRYSIQPATSTDVAFLAMAIDPGASDWGGGNENEQANRLLRTCASSTQVWAVRDRNGVPHALWGVSPKDDDGEVGCMWLLAGEQLEGAPDDFRALSGMVLGEMFSQYARLENYVDAGLIDNTRRGIVIRRQAYQTLTTLFARSQRRCADFFGTLRFEIWHVIFLV